MEKHKRPTQCDRIVQYCKDFGSISALEAVNDLGIMRLASRIAELKCIYNIRSETETKRNRYGEKTSYKRYYIEGAK